MSDDKNRQIRDQNDRFRKGDLKIPGTQVITRGIVDLLGGDLARQAELIRAVATFDDFDTDNDPWGQHDFAAFDYMGERCNWKIDLYDKSYRFGTEDPANLNKTNRVLTIMLASEY